MKRGIARFDLFAQPAVGAHRPSEEFMGEIEFKIRGGHTVHGSKDGVPFTKAELSFWRCLFGDDRILARAIPDEPDGMAAAKEQHERRLELVRAN